MPSYTQFRQTALVFVTALVVQFVGTLPVNAQSNGVSADSIIQFIERGDRASIARHPADALAWYERALKRNPQSFDALWRASRELVDLGEFEPDRNIQKIQYERAEEYARKAMVQRPNEADVHFHVARAVGRTAMAASPRDRVRYAMEVRSQALIALEHNPRHAGALHIMGVWNAEVMRLNPVARAFAKAFMGGQAMKTASWDQAAHLLEEAAAIEPQRLVHQLDLARVYRDMGRTNDARAAYKAALSLPLRDANDDRYRQAAEQELKQLR